jgi:hypothetical protein
MTSNELRKSVESKAFSYGTSEAVATLLGEYVVDLVGQSAPKYGNAIVCPLCGESAEYNEKQFAHVWKCSGCPFVAFEFYGTEDLRHLAHALNARPDTDGPEPANRFDIDVLEGKIDDIARKIDALK